MQNTTISKIRLVEGVNGNNYLRLWAVEGKTADDIWHEHFQSGTAIEKWEVQITGRMLTMDALCAIRNGLTINFL